MLAITVVSLVYIFVRRDELTSSSLFGAVAIFALVAGGMIMLLTNRH